jgi:DNA-binding transcriptional regulator YdaS (Cro superfamily)
MEERKSATDALKRARTAAGGASAVARAIGLTPQAVLQWQVVPAERVLDVEKLTGVSRYDLRPDVFGPAPQEAR